MSYSKRSRDSRSPFPYKRYSGSVPRSVSRSRSRSCDSSIENPGNNLYVTGLSTRATKRDIEKHFSTEGKVEDIHLVVDPWTRESRGFCFVTMSTVEEADRCIKSLNRSVLEGRVIMVEKARRRRGRTPTPGRYLGLRTIHVRHRSPSYSPHYRGRSPRYSSERDRSRSRSPYYSRKRSYSRSPRYSSERYRSRSRSPYYSRKRSYSPHYGRHGSYSPCYSRRISYSRSHSPCSRSPVRRHDRSCSPYESRYYSPYHYYRRIRYRSVSRSISPRVRSWRRSYSCSVSPRPRRSWRSYSRSVSPRRLRRSYSRSISPGHGKSSRRRYSRSIPPRPRKSSWRRRDYSPDSYSSGSYSDSLRGSPSSRSISRSGTPRSASPSP